MALTDEAIEKIKAMIVSGTPRAADRLPKEADLAAGLGLSRSSLREAAKASVILASNGPMAAENAGHSVELALRV